MTKILRKYCLIFNLIFLDKNFNENVPIVLPWWEKSARVEYVRGGGINNYFVIPNRYYIKNSSIYNKDRKPPPKERFPLFTMTNLPMKFRVMLLLHWRSEVVHRAYLFRK